MGLRLLVAFIALLIALLVARVLVSLFYKLFNGAFNMDAPKASRCAFALSSILLAVYLWLGWFRYLLGAVIKHVTPNHASLILNVLVPIVLLLGLIGLIVHMMSTYQQSSN